MKSELEVRFTPAAEGAAEDPALPASPVAQRRQGTTIDGLGPRGLETAELLLSPNPGEELRPLARIASGGELSRVLLAVKRVLAESDPVDAYLFDEVDAGIGGATADAVGRALCAVAKRRQVIASASWRGCSPERPPRSPWSTPASCSPRRRNRGATERQCEWRATAALPGPTSA
jgi:DNA repair ATPase RecN